MKAEKKKKTKKSTKNPEGILITKEFTFKLTDAEIAQKDLGARALTLDINELNAKFKEVRSDWNAKIKSRVASRDDLAISADSGEEKRTVEATMVKDYSSREIKYYYEGEMIESRTMTAEEAQMEMSEFTKGAKRGKKQKLDTTQNLSGMGSETADEEIKDTIKKETNKRTKRSAVDGVTAN